MEIYFILAVLLFLSAMFSGLTLGMMSLSVTELERKITLGDKNATKILKVRKNGSLLLCSLLLANTAVNSAISVFMSSVTTGIIAGAISTISIVLIGEITPQAIFSRHALKYGAKMTWLVRGMMILMWPAAKPVSILIDKLFGKELPTTWDKKEIAEIIKDHEENDIVDSDERRIILGALSFSEKKARRIMTPRTVIFSLCKDTVITEDILRKIKEEGYSRIPIYIDTPDHIMGILLAKSLIGNDTIGKILEDLCIKNPILSFRDNTKLDIILNNLIKTQQMMSFIFDEHGTFQGLVTMEDIVEEIFKTEIMDESDDVADMQEFAKQNVKMKINED